MGAGASVSEDNNGNGNDAKLVYSERAEMVVVPYSVFKSHGSIPRSNANLGIPYASLGNKRRKCFIVFVSHRWLQGQMNPPHPDKDNKKFELICEIFEKMAKGLAKEIELYIWIDFACIDQDDPELKMKGVNSLPSYIERCDALLTPYTDSTLSLQPSTDQVFENPFNELWVNEWTNKFKSLAEYCGRAWCRLEMFIGSNAPLAPGGFNYFHGLGLPRNDRPHFVYGDHQQAKGTNAEVLPRLTNKWYEKVKPSEGALTDSADLPVIISVVDMIRVDKTASDEGFEHYQGDKDRTGRKHGQGEFRYESGASYSGSWNENKRHGQGTMNDVDGACYVGAWKDDVREGQGRYAYADGSVYEGEFSNDKRHGHGMILLASQDRYEGDWRQGERHGRGTFTSSSGAKYEGGWQHGSYEGRGIYTHTTGARYIGMWKNGFKHGIGVYYYSGESDVPRDEGTFVYGKEHGDFLEVKSNGKKMLVTFEKGKKIKEKEYKENEHKAAGKIQKQARKRHKDKNKAATKIQAHARGRAARKGKKGQKKKS
mmetsp:Transcript_18682/g.24658  ORF Transcript_18682/g.24658 Transcript_18682/m.24658 type:complete len:540 (-) Transcript_18682:350-1969(-)|eukprot:CAMPEP_0117757060 /NCGR_PEP_ID=MMETSP0947-20121206/14486_1 /TAXON_ID=44440 /ORGANISM="Chattonella subsalsa, Strain CCMP2191" /LENGTH=539 /DNA_ID=CAMNT_0005576841 /DNA_START=147 /DNA_END=1766 /DNA_ORIENTATION=+